MQIKDDHSDGENSALGSSWRTEWQGLKPLSCNFLAYYTT